MRERDVILLEIGPGHSLCSLAQQHPARRAGEPNIPTLRHPQDAEADESFLLKAVGRLWLAGAEIDWEAFYVGEGARRVPLPSYPFERQPYLVRPGDGVPEQFSRPATDGRRQSSSLSKEALEDWFYLPSWKQAAPPAPAPGARAGRWLVFDDGSGFGKRLAHGLAAQGHEVTRALRGGRFARVSEQVYALDPARPEDYESLLGELRAAGGPPERIVHAWSLTPPAAPETSDESLDEALGLGFHSLLHLTRALAAQNIVEPLRIEVLTDGVQDVNGEEPLSPEKAAVLGPGAVIRQEYGNFLCRCVDVALPAPGTRQEERLLAQLLAEFASDPTERVVAYRGPHCWTQVYERVGAPPAGGATLRERGVYMITGGLGRVGSALSGHLAREWRARLVLVGRTPLPAREAWDEWLAEHEEGDAVARRIGAVRSLEESGAEVLVVPADVTDEREMREALRQAEARFGRLDGVIHAVKGSGRASYLIPDMDAAAAQVYFRPKAYGAVVLERVLRGRELDFCMLMSTISSVLGGLGLSSVAATNIFLDALARRQSRRGPIRWVSVNWDMWRFEKDAAQQTSGKSFAELGMTTEEAAEVFERALGPGAPQHLVVSTGDLRARMAQWVSIEPQAEARPAGAVESSLHPRPQLSSIYVAPSNELEQTIAAVWQELLGFDQIGVYDNFFELGGHSLLATQVTAHVRARCQVNLPLRALFENPTIGELANIIENTLIEEIDRLNEQEAEEMLRQEVEAERGLA